VNVESLSAGGQTVGFHSIAELEPRRLPYTLRILLENVLRAGDESGARDLAAWDPAAEPSQEIAFFPSRVLMQDLTGVPAVVDLAAIRDAAAALGRDPAEVNPLIPAELVIDHSVQVDAFASRMAFEVNVEREVERNRERYAFLRWGQGSLRDFKLVPPGTGICHQVNLELLARVVEVRDGVGVGGIEAEAALLGEPVSMLVPQVVGLRLIGRLREGTTATDLVLTVTELLRATGVVGKFVEYFGEGVSELTVADRATLGNMSPEYGATCGFFAVDELTLDYLRLTGRPEAHVELVEAYCRENLLWHEPGEHPEYSHVVELDLSEVEPSLAGPRRPQDRVPLARAKESFIEALGTFGVEYGNGDEAVAETFPASDPTTEQSPGGHPGVAVGGVALGAPPRPRSVTTRIDDEEVELSHGAVVIAAITSCTNTSNPQVMVAAGLLAKRAVELGLRRAPWVKTSLAPGSRVVTDYYERSGLQSYLDELGFNTVGYGCTTCIGNSGPLPAEVSAAIAEGDLVACAVLSGNRNFEARIHPEVKANYLASPPLVVAYALAGRIDLDVEHEPLAVAADGREVFLRDVWPSAAEIQETIASSVQREMFERTYADVYDGDNTWQSLTTPAGDLYDWDPGSTYVRRPPYFEGLRSEPDRVADIHGARCLVSLGDSVTTDHISPAGSIRPDSPAGSYLIEHGVGRAAFNSYGSRRGNHEVMVRGTFANVRLRNLLVPGSEGTWTKHLPSGDEMSIFEASERYLAEGTPLVVLAGKEYGTGSSRDWAAKGPKLLGVKAVIAESYERIHRSNLLMMGILPLVYHDGESRETLGLTGAEEFSIEAVDGGDAHEVTVRADDKRFSVILRLDTPREREYVKQGGILPYVVRRLAAGA
jgi:aconitate hydratase